MKLHVQGNHGNPRNVMRRCGYAEQPLNRKGEVSYAKRLAGTPFPRFHAYVDAEVGGFTINLHLDQKAPTYRGSSAHNGEYDGPVVEAEIARLEQLVK